MDENSTEQYENDEFGQFLSKRDVIMRILFVILGLAIIALSLFIWQIQIRHHPPGSRAKGTLRSIGSSQLAYRELNDQGQYGSLPALQATLGISDRYNLGNMIENYSMTWEAHNISIAVGEPLVSQFTVIAYPRDTRYASMATFCITEDQIVRVYLSGKGYEFESIYHWDPIL